MYDCRSQERGRVFANAYGSFGRVGRGARSWWERDSIALRYLAGAFHDLGFALGGTIMNAPGTGPDIRPFDLSGFRPNDLIYQATRPPIHDWELGVKKFVPRSYTSLEQLILYHGPFQLWFRTLSRAEIVLTKHATDLSAEIAALRTQEYVQYDGSMFRYVISASGHKEPRGKIDARTAAYLVYTPHLWSNGPAYLCAFGLGAADTLAWCVQLATRFRHLLLTTSFAMGEMPAGAWPEDADTANFAMDRLATILGSESSPVEPPARPSGGRSPADTKLRVSM
jgi:hypothetical protein